MHTWPAVFLSVGAVALLAGCDGEDDTFSGPVASDAGAAITVKQLIERQAETPVAVRGLEHVSEGAARLCGAVLESYPPQCGEPAVELAGLDVEAIGRMSTAAGVAWKGGRRADSRAG